MEELEKVREKIQNYYRVVRTFEDLEWNRAINLCTNIINAELNFCDFLKEENGNE